MKMKEHSLPAPQKNPHLGAIFIYHRWTGEQLFTSWQCTKGLFDLCGSLPYSRHDQASVLLNDCMKGRKNIGSSSDSQCCSICQYSPCQATVKAHGSPDLYWIWQILLRCLIVPITNCVSLQIIAFCLFFSICDLFICFYQTKHLLFFSNWVKTALSIPKQFSSSLFAIIISSNNNNNCSSTVQSSINILNSLSYKSRRF